MRARRAEFARNQTASRDRVQDDDFVPRLFIEADAPLSSSQDWIVPARLLDSMVQGHALSVGGAISPLLQANLQSIQDIYRAWLPAAKEVPVNSATLASETRASGGSVFFSGGVDSFYSLLKHRERLDNLVLVHGFDVPLAAESFFEQVRSVAGEVAALFEMRLIVARTNLRAVSQGRFWEIQHGAALASIAHALQPNHSAVYIGSTHPYRDLHVWGSHPLVDPLWSSAAVQIIHDGAETDRVGKLKLICQYPEVIKYLRVCLQGTGAYNCGTCEKCLRTMVGLLSMDSLRYARFPSTVDPGAVRRVRLDDDSVLYWRELLALDLPAPLRPAIEHAIRNHAWGLPPHGSAKNELRRIYCAAGRLGRLLQAFFS
jgi:hypothetical protein